MVDRLVAVDDADYRLPEPVRQALDTDLVSNIGDDGTAIGSAVKSVVLDNIDFGAGTRGATIAELGDSMTARNGPFVSGGIVHQPANGWFNWANAALGQRFRVVANFSVAGKRTDEILVEQLPLLLALDPLPSYVTVFGGANDVVQNRTAAQVIADLDAIYSQLNAVGIQVIVGTVTPQTGLTTPQKAVLYAINAWIKTTVQARRGVWLIDWFSVMSAADGAPLTDVLADNVHQTTRGAVRMGSVFAKTVAPLVPAVDVLPLPGDPTNLAPNPLKLLGTGGILESNVTGSVAQSYRATTADANPCTAVCALNARDDGVPGLWQDVTVSAGNFRLSTGSVTAAPGEVWEAVQEIEITPTSGNSLTRVSLVLAASGASGQSVSLGAHPFVLDGMGVTLTSLIPGRMVLRTAPLTLIAGTTAVIATVQVFGTTGGSPIRLGRLSMRKVS